VEPDRLSAWVEEGRELLHAMRTELGGGFDVRYHLDATAWPVPPPRPDTTLSGTGPRPGSGTGAP
jgi:hypothetical protein